MRRRARRGERGFSLIEAVVALGIAAMTLMVVSGAIWSVRLVDDRRAAADVLGPDALLTTRRALGRWASAVTTATSASGVGFAGGPFEARMLLSAHPPSGTPARLATLRIARDQAAAVLVAQFGGSDGSLYSRLDEGTARTAELLRSTGDLRLVYLSRPEPGAPAAWIAQTAPDAGLPQAIGVAIGGEVRVMAGFAQNTDGACLVERGIQQRQIRQCAIR